MEAIVADYFHMLTLELAGQAVNKTAHRTVLKRLLNGRPDGSVERKHQNISAILLELGCPYIRGYKPLPNYQSVLRDAVVERLSHDKSFDLTALSAVEQPAASPLIVDPEGVLVEPPPLVLRTGESRTPYRVDRKGIFRDYLDREARNRSLGEAGEAFVVEFEQRRLHAGGARKLADRVEHVARSRGDGLGYDVMSYETDGRERFIEVKTTSFGQMTPFYVSRNEVDFSEEVGSQFHLYRLFDFRKSPRMFDLPGPVNANFRLDPVSFRASFG
ncbi:MAG: hypothetical protein RJA99_134 [Pseudomonadota bacterium]